MAGGEATLGAQEMTRLVTVAGQSLVRAAGAMMVGAVLLLVQGCAPEILDYRNAEGSNGRIYQKNANKPFSGKVTNVPDADLLRGQAGFKTLSQRVLQFGLKHGHAADRALLTSSLCDVELKDGAPHGSAICHFQGAKSKRFEMAFKEGALHGPLKYYQPNAANSLLATASFKNGFLDGHDEIFDIAVGKLALRSEWEMGKQNGRQETYDINTGALFATSEWRNGKMHGTWVNYAPDGKTLVFKAEYVDGMKSGVEERFDPATGARVLHGEWLADKRHGDWKEWGLDGKPGASATWREGALIDLQQAQTSQAQASSPAQAAQPLNACADRWMAAHRKEVGQDATVSPDQLEEWADWCKQGKLPPQ